VPLGLMLGVLMAFRRLATSSELDVMRAVGLSYTRLLRVPYIIAVVLAVFNLLIVSYVQPNARYYYEKLTFQLSSGALGAAIRVGEFNTLKDKMSLRIEQSRDEGRELVGIFLRVTESRGEVLSVTARKGRFLALHENPDTVILRLTDGQIVQDPPVGQPRVLNFTSHDLPIDLPSVEKFRSAAGWSGNICCPNCCASAGPRIRRPKPRHCEGQPKLSPGRGGDDPAAALAGGVAGRAAQALVLVPGRVHLHRDGRGLSQGQRIWRAGLSLGKLDPWLALWVPFGIFAAIIIWMYYTLAYVPGGQPIGALERFFANSTKRIMRLVSKPKKHHGAEQGS
jgi:lipopolysaccharide export system permease protein